MKRRELMRGKNAKVLHLFKPDTLKQLKRNRFNGRLMIVWKNGDIVSCRLSSSLEFRMLKHRNEDEAEFWFDDGFW